MRKSQIIVSADELEKVLGIARPVIASCDSTLVTIMTANNEIGTIQHIRELSEISHRHGAVLHTDAVQAVGHIAVKTARTILDVLVDNIDYANLCEAASFMPSRNARVMCIVSLFSRLGLPFRTSIFIVIFLLPPIIFFF